MGLNPHIYRIVEFFETTSVAIRHGNKDLLSECSNKWFQWGLGAGLARYCINMPSLMAVFESLDERLHF